MLMHVQKELHETYEGTSKDLSSLASALAQHDGFVRFSTEFANRAPPLEYTLMQPKVRSHIENCLEELDKKVAKLKRHQVDPESRTAQILKDLVPHLEQLHAAKRQEFEAQLETLKELVRHSPLRGPAINEELCRKLAEKMRSQSPRTGSAASSPPGSPRLEALSLPPACDVEEETSANSWPWPGPTFELRILGLGVF